VLTELCYYWINELCLRRGKTLDLWAKKSKTLSVAP
jgi:hypothetical protein